MIVSRGNPGAGVIIRAGSLVDLPEFWAKKFIEDGTAVAAESEEKEENSAIRGKEKK